MPSITDASDRLILEKYNTLNFLSNSGVTIMIPRHVYMRGQLDNTGIIEVAKMVTLVIHHAQRSRGSVL